MDEQPNAKDYRGGRRYSHVRGFLTKVLWSPSRLTKINLKYPKLLTTGKDKRILVLRLFRQTKVEGLQWERMAAVQAFDSID